MARTRPRGMSAFPPLMRMKRISFGVRTGAIYEYAPSRPCFPFYERARIITAANYARRRFAEGWAKYVTPRLAFVARPDQEKDPGRDGQPAGVTSSPEGSPARERRGRDSALRVMPTAFGKYLIALNSLAATRFGSLGSSNEIRAMNWGPRHSSTSQSFPIC
jgi:hypothetical protein